LADPTLAEKFSTILRHYDAMLDHYGVLHGLKIARKHLGWYSKGLPNSAELRSKIMRADEPAMVRGMLGQFFEPLIGREAA
jgi:tRNA-dihydrouridine synthase B